MLDIPQNTIKLPRALPQFSRIAGAKYDGRLRNLKNNNLQRSKPRTMLGITILTKVEMRLPT